MNNFLNYCLRNKFLICSLIVAAIIYSLISLVNHYCFRTYTLDLGLYTNALYDYAHFQFNDSRAFKDVSENLLADHFDLYLPLLSPLSYIFGSYTLLIVQILSVLFGAVGIYKLFQNSKLQKFALLYFLCFFSVFSAVSYDYHSNVVAAMFIPWLFLAFKSNRWKQAWIFLVLILIAKENMSLWMLFVSLGLFWLYRKDKIARRNALVMAVVSVVYFVLILGVVMPSFSNSGKYHHFNYSVLGSNATESIIFMLTHPIEAFRTLFINHTDNPGNDYVKAELWIFIGSLGFLLIRKPIYIFMLIPIFAQKMYNDNSAMWTINAQYAIEFAPILTIGVFEVIELIKNRKIQYFMAGLMVVLSIGFTIRSMDSTVSYTEKARIRFYKSAHYNREYSISQAHKLIKLIPDDAIVSAQSSLLPHLALRDNIYLFPTIGNAEYVIYSPIDYPYPVHQEEFDLIIGNLAKDDNWEKIYFTNELVLLKRKK